MSRAESFNPYEAPRAEVVLRPNEFLTLPPMPFSVGDVMSRSWAIFQARMGLCIGIFAAGFGLNIGSSFLLTAILWMAQAAGTDQGTLVGIQLVMQLVLGLFNFFINVGQAIAFLKIARGEPTKVSDIFTGGPFLLKVVIATFVIGVVSWVGMLLGAAPGGLMMIASGPRDVTAILVIMLGVLVMVTILSVFWVRVSQYMYAAIDTPGIGALDSIRRSMDVTRGHFWGISAVYLLLFLINIAGALMLLIGLIITIPLSFLMVAVMYAALAGTPTPAEKPAPEFLA